MEIVAIVSLAEFENICVNRVDLAAYKLKRLKDDIENGSMQSFEKTVAELKDIISTLARVQTDLDAAARKLSKETV